jgi:hypothetical protein
MPLLPFSISEMGSETGGGEPEALAAYTFVFKLNAFKKYFCMLKTNIHIHFNFTFPREELLLLFMSQNAIATAHKDNMIARATISHIVPADMELDQKILTRFAINSLNHRYIVDSNLSVVEAVVRVVVGVEIELFRGNCVGYRTDDKVGVLLVVGPSVVEPHLVYGR